MEKLVTWVEIPAENFGRAVKFYTHILKIEFEVYEYETEKMACFPTGEGAISYGQGFHPSANGTLVSLNRGKDLDATIERIVDLGGKIIQPKTKIEAENRGYFALFLDSEGNRVGLYGDC